MDAVLQRLARSNKIVNLHVFDDEKTSPNVSVKDIDGDILLLSQFTLQTSTKKGNRRAYLKASIIKKANFVHSKTTNPFDFYFLIPIIRIRELTQDSKTYRDSRLT